MKISKRLKLIASLVENDSVVDIGCDHALLDIYLTFNNKKCIASDISEKVIENAKRNIDFYNLTNKIDVIISNGTKNIIIPKKSSIIISGMGRSTIIDILKNTNHNNIDELIIQSNNEHNILRKQIIELGYYIKDEVAILDKDKYYVIIKFKKGFIKYSKKDLLLGPILNDKDYFKYLYNKNKDIIKKISLTNIKKYKLLIYNHYIKQKLR